MLQLKILMKMILYLSQALLFFFLTYTSIYNYTIFVLPRALSSVGSEHLVYTQGVGGSNPSAPTFPNPLVKQKAYL